MKKLEELDISPAPWRFISRDEIGADVRCAWKGIAMKRRHTMVVRDAYIDDARLIAAAPKLYDALYDMLLVTENRLPSQPTLGEIEAVVKAKSALAEAAGESEVAK